ncbi:MAG: aminotransferase class V-fold PLP-dependent enzyme, partial [Oscillospiraceae bacterium]|nr:aminotransferase class V-fold PLP-dependent enzyme [Oscillospiraceae bacterium]
MSRLVYLDNAATSWPKPKNVINAVNESFLRCGNPGRSGHEFSLYSMNAVYSCRETICSFFNFSHPENVIFTYNTTYALNLAIKGIMGNEGEIVISNLEHNSVIRPVKEMERQNKNIRVKVFDALENDDIVISNFTKALSDQTKMCVITMCSNVTGKIMPYKEISEICRQKRIALIFDAAQLAGLYPIDLSSLYFSAVCFAGHKSLYGIMGTGFCIFDKNIEPKSIIQGGNGTASLNAFQDMPLPERLE